MTGTPTPGRPDQRVPSSETKENEEKLTEPSMNEREVDDFEAAKTVGEDTSNIQYTSGWQLGMIMFTINMSTLIASLDMGIVATAIPAITEDFDGLELIGWYSGVAFLVVGASSASWAKAYKFLSARYAFMVALAIYVIGSAIAGPAPNGIALIVGRALQGLGCSGCLSGSVLIINYTAAPKHRPMLIGLWIGVFMCATIFGPVLGGIFTTEVTWRVTWKEILFHLDIPGFSILFSSLVCFSLALQWGGVSRSWSDGSVISTLVMWIVLTIAFVVVEYFEGDYAGMPLHLLKPRMTWANCIYGWLNPGANFLVLFYLPYYFQAVKGTSAIISGVYTLPFMAFFALGTMISGGLIGSTRLIHPFTISSGLLITLGAGLFWGMDINTSKAWYIGAQVPFGLGIGLGNQVPVTVLQAFSKPEYVAATTGIIFTFQTVTGEYFVVAAQSIFENRLIQTLASTAPQINIGAVLAAGGSQLQRLFAPSELGYIRDAYMVGIKDVFAFCIAVSAANVLAALLVPFQKLPTAEKQHEDFKQAYEAN